MIITEEKVRHVANLAKLEFPEGELTGFTKKFSDIIDMVELLDEVNVDNVAFTSNVFDDFNVWREDVAVNGMDRVNFLENAPASEDGFLKVPDILDEGNAES